MKIKILALFSSLFIYHPSIAQNMETIEKDLTKAYNRIDYWHEHSDKDEHDSIGMANNRFEKTLLKYTSSNPATINYNFKGLITNGLNIQTSQDGLFRIYSWDDMSGGTMRYFRNIFQYKTGDKTYSKTLQLNTQEDDMPDMGCIYTSLNQVTISGKNYYIGINIAIGSSALYLYTIKIFSINNGKLNDKAKLIMTRTGLHNELSYEVDWSSGSNRNSTLDRDIANADYDAKNNIISIPLIQEDEKVTTKKIRYKFNGQYFVKM